MKKFLKNYGFILFMLLGIIAGCIVGALWPAVREGDDYVVQGARVLEPLGTIFTNLMFCVVVPMVFCSIASAIANMGTVKLAGKVIGSTIATFVVTSTMAAVMMYVICRFVPLVQGQYIENGPVDEAKSVGQLVVNFFTKPDFVELLSRKAILPLIVFAVLFGFGVQMAGGQKTMTAKFLADVTEVIMKMVKIITYYAPIGFFGFFAYLVATHGPDLIGDYSRALILYYGVSFGYVLLILPLYARFGGGKGAIRHMYRHILKPAAVSFGTCSSVATIPTNAEAARESGISKDVSNIVLPLGSTMNMDGSAMSAIVKVAFLFAFFQKDFFTGEAILAIVVAVLSSVAMSGIPGGGGTGEIVLCTLFFPDQMAVAYPIAIALGNLVDPPATMVNATGDYVCCYIVERFVTGKDWLKKHLAQKKNQE